MSFDPLDYYEKGDKLDQNYLYWIRCQKEYEKQQQCVHKFIKVVRDMHKTSDTRILYHKDYLYYIQWCPECGKEGQYLGKV